MRLTEASSRSWMRTWLKRYNEMLRSMSRRRRVEINSVYVWQRNHFVFINNIYIIKEKECNIFKNTVKSCMDTFKLWIRSMEIVCNKIKNWNYVCLYIMNSKEKLYLKYSLNLLSKVWNYHPLPMKVYVYKVLKTFPLIIIQYPRMWTEFFITSNTFCQYMSTKYSSQLFIKDTVN